jgi:hypothetical protein
VALGRDMLIARVMLIGKKEKQMERNSNARCCLQIRCGAGVSNSLSVKLEWEGILGTRDLGISLLLREREANS